MRALDIDPVEEDVLDVPNRAFAEIDALVHHTFDLHHEALSLIFLVFGAKDRPDARAPD
jgi:hypothetical protein